MFIDVIVANLLVLLVPGVNFILITNVSLRAGVYAALLCSFGVTCAIMTHVLICLYFCANITSMPNGAAVVPFIKIIGALVVVFIGALIGTKAFGIGDNTHNPTKIMASTSKRALFNKIDISKRFFLQGVLIDLFNPIISVFYISVFAQNIGTQTSYSEYLVTVLAIFFITVSWFSLVGIFFSMGVLRSKYLRYKKSIELFTASALVFVGVKHLVFG